MHDRAILARLSLPATHSAGPARKPGWFPQAVIAPLRRFRTAFAVCGLLVRHTCCPGPPARRGWPPRAANTREFLWRI